jgi:galactokinase/mevalonate kinase-like predicted kinase
VNAAISLRAHVTIARRDDGRIELHSVETDRRINATGWPALNGSGDLGLLERLARHWRLENATLTTRGESPTGAGIAGSSALIIAACGALARWTGGCEDPEQLMSQAMNIECQVIRVLTRRRTTGLSWAELPP